MDKTAIYPKIPPTAAHELKADNTVETASDCGAELTRLVEKFSALVFRVAFCHVKNRADADDIMQDVFLALYTSGKTFRDDEHIKAWLIRVTVNRCRNLLRSCRHRLSLPLENAEEVPFQQKERIDLIPQIMKLKPKYRLALYMFYYEDLPVSRIAEILREKPSTVTTRLSRGRKQLKELLIKEGYDEL